MLRTVVGVVLILAAAGLHAGEPTLDTTAQRMRACEGCHGAQGRATPDGYFPRIAGKPAGYLYQQLQHFRDGRRQHPQMAYLLDRQTSTYLMQMARYFATLDLPYPSPPSSQVDEGVLATGATLAREGDAARELPACSACHGENLTGLQPAVPGLLGLPPDYLAAQIGAWRSGARQAADPDCMAVIAARLTPADVTAVAAWLAAQPVPEAAHASDGVIRGDLECGSQRPSP